MQGHSQNLITTGDCAHSVQRHPLHIGQNTTTLHLTPAPQSCTQRITNTPQPCARGDMLVTERDNGRSTTPDPAKTAQRRSVSLYGALRAGTRYFGMRH